MPDEIQPTNPTKGEAPDFEALVAELEAVVDRLERGETSLESALADFERGMALSREAGAILEAAEERIDELLEGADGELEEAPL